MKFKKQVQKCVSRRSQEKFSPGVTFRGISEHWEIGAKSCHRAREELQRHIIL